MLQFNSLSKRHGSHAALSDVSFQALPGRVTAFLGPNGAGKSSTLRILLGLDRPTTGTALVNGQAYSKLPDPLRTVGSMLDGSRATPFRRCRRRR